MRYLKKHRDEILIFSFFVLISIVATYPLIFRMQSYLYGESGDTIGVARGIWWFKYAWLHHLSPSFCPLLASPFGIDYSQIPSFPVMNFFLKLLALSVNEIFAYNLILFLSFPLSALTMYYLVHFFTQNRVVSIFPGIIYAFCPYHLVHATQHLGIANIQWLPLYALTLFKLNEERSYKYAFLTAIAFSLIVFTDYYQAYFAAIFTMAFVVWRGWWGIRGRRTEGGKQVNRWENKQVSREQRVEATKLSSGQDIKQSSNQAIKMERQTDGEVERQKDRSPRAPRQMSGSDRRSPFKTMKVMLVAIVVAVAIILPATYSTLKTASFTSKTESKGYMHPFRDLTSNSARPLGYLLPSQDNPFFGRFTKRFIKSPFYGGHPTEHTLYLGWVGIVFSIVAIREWRRKSKLVNKLTSRQVNKGIQKQKTDNRLTGQPANWQTSQRGVSFFFFAAIVALIFSRSPWTDIGSFRILFPSYFMYKIAPMFRVYARFGLLVMLCVSVLAGIGLASILERMRNTKRKRIFLSVVLLLIFIEFAPALPAPMVNAVKPPPVYEWLAKQEGDFIVAEYPLEDDVEYLFWQRIHQKRLVNGALSHTYADEVRKEIVDILKPETPGILKFLGARYVILHPDKYLKSEDVPVIGEVPDINKQKGLRLVKTFKEAIVYEVVAKPQRPKVEKVERVRKGEINAKCKISN